MTNLIQPTLPDNLVAPLDDGACDHLVGMTLPSVRLETSQGLTLDPSKLTGLSVIYIYPMSGPDSSGLPDNWDEIPGARGCTPQACSFRNHHQELAKFGAQVFGLATQPAAYLASEVERIHLPYALLSDEQLSFQKALNLPLFDVLAGGRRVLKRVTLICRDHQIIHVIYPVFPPDRAADQVIEWLQNGDARP